MSERLPFSELWNQHWRNLPMEAPIVAVEQALRQWTGRQYALAHTSGTMALLAAWFGVGIRPGQEVIVPSLACSAVASPLLVLGARPVFCDVDPRTLTIDPWDVENRITGATRGVCAVHMWGNPCAVDILERLCRQHGLALVEDCAQAPGAVIHGRPAGSFGDVSVFSMQGSKALGGGEGGAIVTDSAQVYDRILVLGHPGRVQHSLVDPQSPFRSLGESTLGLKLRPTALSMALALAKMEALAAHNHACQATAARYDELFLPMPGVRVVRVNPGCIRGGMSSVYPLIYTGDLRGAAPIPQFVARLCRYGVHARVGRYPPLHRQATFSMADELFGRVAPRCVEARALELPHTEHLAGRILSLPLPHPPAPDALAAVAASVFRSISWARPGLPSKGDRPGKPA
jgi:dTDP-4-amino-4,6-dideoxygalactose transaminase